MVFYKKKISIVTLLFFALFTFCSGIGPLWADEVKDLENEKTVAEEVYSSDIKVTGITLDKESFNLEVDGESVKLNETIEPLNATNKNVIWKSSEEKIVRVEEGLLTPVAEGSAVVTVITEDGGFEASCQVSVEAKVTEQSFGKVDERFIVPGKILIKYKNNAKQKSMDDVSRKYSAKSVAVNKKIGINKLVVSKEKNIFKIINELKKNPNIEYAEPVYKCKALGSVSKNISNGDKYIAINKDKQTNKNTGIKENEYERKISTLTLDNPNDPYYVDRWQWGLYATDMKHIWDDVTLDERSQVIIAILDTGVAPHLDLASNILSCGYDCINDNAMIVSYDDHGHGTHVAGIAAAIADNGICIAGVAGGAKIMPVKVLDENGAGDSETLINGIYWSVINGADIINLSLGHPRYFNDNGTLIDTFSQAEFDAVQFALANNVIVIASAGNDSNGYGNEEPVGYPAAYDGVIGVGAVDYNNGFCWADFSNVGPEVDVSAPGVAIVSTSNVEDYAIMSGTSQAAPFVSGLAALLSAEFPGIPKDVLEAVLKISAVDVGDPGIDNYFGAGVINGLRAFNILTVSPTPVTFNDSNLENALRIQMGKLPSEPITQLDMANLTHFQALNCGIADLTGLEYAVNLEFLDLYNNLIEDISSLSNLHSLRDVTLWLNDISDISPLQNLDSLEYLDLEDNRIINIDSLSNLLNLSVIYLSLNYIQDISALVTNSNNGGLGAGDSVYLSNNYLDLSDGSQALNDINILTSNGVTVEYTPQAGVVPVTGVSLDRNTLEFTEGDAPETLVATVEPADATNKNVSWSSDDTGVATVVDGEVTPIGTGNCTITVTTEDGSKTATCAVKVNAGVVTVPVTGVSLDRNTLEFTEGDAPVTLVATVEPADATNKNVSWSSDDTGVATVVDGEVTPIGAGNCTITVTTEDGSKTATCAVKVNAGVVAVTGVSLDRNTLEFTEGDASETLVATVEPANATNKEVSWSSDDIGVATVADGEVTPIGAGNCTITVTTVDGSKTDTCAVTVNAVVVTVPVTGVSLDRNTLEFTEGDASVTLVVTVEPADATNKDVSWSSDDIGVATVVDGVVTPVGAGNCTITVTTVDGSFTDTCAVTVNAAVVTVPVIGVSLDRNTLEFTEGDASVTLVATVESADATNKDVSWSSDDTTIATVVNGLVTPVGAGNCTITVTTVDGSFTDTCAVTVNAAVVTVPVTGVSLDRNTLEFTEGDAPVTLVATVEPADATNKNVSWSSDDIGVATVVDGVVTPVGAGNCTITVTTENGSFTDTCAVIVKQKSSGGNGGGSSSGSSGGSSSSSSSKYASLRNTKTSSDRKVNTYYKKHGTAKYIFGNTIESASFSSSFIKELGNKNLPLSLEKDGVRIQFNNNSFIEAAEFIANQENSSTELELGIKILSQEEKEKILAKAKISDGTGLFEIGGVIIDLTAYVCYKDKNGKQIRKKIQSFNEPVVIILDLSKLDLTEKDIENLTGIRYKIDSNGNVIPEKLGGTYNSKTKAFTFYTDSFSLYGVLKANKLVKVSLQINNSLTKINKKFVLIDVPPQIINNRTMVPIRFISESLGAVVNWLPETKTVEIELDGKKISLVIDQLGPGLDVAPTLINNRTFLPLRYISENFGANLLWHDSTRTIEIIR